MLVALVPNPVYGFYYCGSKFTPGDGFGEGVIYGSSKYGRARALGSTICTGRGYGSGNSGDGHSCHAADEVNYLHVVNT